MCLHHQVMSGLPRPQGQPRPAVNPHVVICDKTEAVFQTSQGHVRPTRPGPSPLTLLWVLSVKRSDRNYSGAGRRLDPELLQFSQTSIGVAWQEASCQDDLNHPDCREQKLQGGIWAQCYYWHTELRTSTVQWDEEVKTIAQITQQLTSLLKSTSPASA